MPAGSAAQTRAVVARSRLWVQGNATWTRNTQSYVISHLAALTRGFVNVISYDMMSGTTQKASTRDRIMRALASEVLERGAHDFSVQGVADRAGISHRTVYRYFPTREDLFHAYGGWLDEQLGDGAYELPRGLGELAAASVGVFERFERVPLLAEAYVRILATGAAVAVHDTRKRAFVNLVKRDARDVDKRHQLALAAVLRQVVSSATWAQAREEFGVGGEELGEVVKWIVDLVREAVETGEVPEPWKGKSR